MSESAPSAAPASGLGERFPKVVAEDLPRVAERLARHVSALSSARVFVSGASGMLAAYFVDTLAALNDLGVLRAPCRLTLLVRNRRNASRRLGHLQGRSDVEFIEQDARAALPEALSFDYALHAAAPSGPREYLADPIGSLDANTSALRQVLERGRGSAGVLYLSSSEVYGTPDSEAIPTPESYVGRVDPLSRRAFYAEAKRAGETYCLAYHEAFGVPVKVARPFHVHGPGLGQHDQRVVPALISLALSGRPLALESDGRATRTYGYVADAAVAFVRLLLGEHHGQAFNVGNDRPQTSVLELAEIIARLVGQREPVRVNTDPSGRTAEGAPARACPDLGKLRRAFQFEPEVGLEDGLARTLRWMAQK